MDRHAPSGLATARLLFAEQGAVPGGIVAEPILRSWRRCAELGHDMRRLRPQEPLTSPELRAAQERSDALRRMCRPVLDMLAASAPGRDGLVILTDAQGLVLDTRGDPAFASRAARVALMAGARWDESMAGTNAIGTALAENRAIAVHGGEHFFDANHILTCSAVPVTDARGRLLGVLDLSGPAGAVPHALARVRQAVDLAEHTLFEHDYAHCTLLGLHADRSQLGTPAEAVLAFDGDLLTGANRHARAAFMLDPAAVGVLRYGDLFEGSPETPDTLRRTVSGECWQARVRAPLRAAATGQASDLAAWSSAPEGALDAGRPVESTARALVPHLARQAPQRRAPAPFLPARREPAACFDEQSRAALARAVRMQNAGVAVLLQGETGTGKEMFARAMHARSLRADRPFVAVNCAALPESLIEAELFGYEDGAFTGARRHGSKGLLRQAEGGVLFLDEIGDMPLGLQARLLRVLQTREVVPLGGAHAVPLDVALVCATHRRLADHDAEPVLRPDLYFRIAEYTVTLAPLRERADRTRLVRQLWRTLAPEFSLPDDLAARLAAHDWPGNVRQLVSVLRTLAVLAEEGGVARADMLPADLGTPARAAPDTLAALQDDRIDAVLRQCEGNVGQAARRLGLHRSTLYRRLQARRGAH
ncbi:sigma-54-dependent Fis family transcriptional regulator [Bordetella genomosp. 5]|uniref:Sigma-54-dependent Fis family transcriptional regulator n=1 Tax=Bordetella genomosp. 5 TaxID=1395608 RepID=A0A261U0X2_9BORD|nr:sigma-54-dependent Fis family transcriptional regulator [Bordetella genomosp. 5]OZI55285.1 sigma-54-dependent Fis family transcriptional regulator [Bordetella genomosp. 5]